MIQKVILGILILLTVNITLQINKDKSLESLVEAFVKDTVFKTSSIGFSAIDVQNGEKIATYNSMLSLTPASTVKLFSTATALELLGSKHKFTTQIAYSGKIDSLGVLHGNIFIIGGGDPVLGSEYFKKYYNNPNFLTVWANAIKNAGIRYIDGRIVANNAIFHNQIIPDTWSWEDIGNYYGATANGLSIYENTYKITFKSGKKAGDATKIIAIEPPMPDLKFENHVKASSKRSDEAYIYGSPLSKNRTITGTIPKARNRFIVKGAIPNPPIIAGLELEKMLRQNGIRIAKTPESSNEHIDRKQIKILTTSYSPPLDEIINRTNKKSINLLAEHLLNHVGRRNNSVGSTKKGTDEVVRFWKERKMDTDGLFLIDGSGLSRYNAVTANQFTFLLQYMYKNSKYLKSFYNSLPVAGKSGTLRNRCKGTTAEGNLRAKSGTLYKVKSYAGYFKNKSGRRIAFAIIVNNYLCNSGEISAKMEKFLVDMTETND